MTKGPRGALLPADDEQAELISKIPQSTLVRVTVARVRNGKFLRKYFALLKFAYDMWAELQPPRQHRGQPVITSFERFRDEVTILAGHYETVWNIQGEMRLQAKSVSFARMSEEDFEKFYSHVIDVLLQKVLSSTQITPQKLRAYVDQVMAFD